MANKSILWFFIIFFFAAMTSADISSSIKLSETKTFLVPNLTISVSFINVDLLKERYSLLINEKKFDVLVWQSIEIENAELTLIQASGSSVKDFSLSFVISGIGNYECEKKCENNTLVNLIKAIKPDFRLCKKDCTVGCGLYKEKECFEDDVWLIDNCANQIQLLENCTNSCVSDQCVDCDNGNCDFPETFANCIDCKERPNYCISAEDCKKNEYCVHGKCSKSPFVIGDGICSLPQENCTSVDCSCDKTSQEIKLMQVPIILVHGFASSPLQLRKLERELSYDLDYKNGGELSMYNLNCNSIDPRTVYVATYYEQKQENEDKKKGMSVVLKSAFDKISESKKEDKKAFPNALSKIISRVKSCSGSDQVAIIAHSMGGTVIRSYLTDKNNIHNVAKLIILGTPNHGGIYGKQTYKLFKGLEAPLGDRKELLKSCSVIGVPSIALSLIDGRDVTGDCQQLSEAGSIIDKIYQIDETPGILEYYTIAGDIDTIGDGVVETKSVALKGAIFNKIVPCSHFDLKNPNKCRESYNLIIKALGYDLESLKKDTFQSKAKEFFFTIGDWFIQFFE